MIELRFGRSFSGKAIANTPESNKNNAIWICYDYSLNGFILIIRLFILVIFQLSVGKSKHNISTLFLFPGAMTYVIALKCRDLNGRVSESNISNIVHAGMMVFVSTLTNDTIGPDGPDLRNGPDMTDVPDTTNDPDATSDPDLRNEPITADPVPTEDPTTSGQDITDNPGILIGIIYGIVAIAVIIGVIIVMAVVNQNQAQRIARPRGMLPVQDPYMRLAPYQNPQFLGHNFNDVRII